MKCCVKTDEIEASGFGHVLAGKLVLDENKNCLTDSSDLTLSDWIIELTRNGKKAYRSVRQNGEYSTVIAPGIYDVKILPLNDLWAVCNAEVQVDLTTGDVLNQNFYAQKQKECYLIKTDISTPFLRRCFDNTYTLTYQNQGTDVAENARIEVEFDDDLSFVNTDFPDYTISANVLTFNIGNLDINGNGRINIKFNLNCNNTTIGQTHCVTATAFPNEPCTVSPNWSGAILSIDGDCILANNTVNFKIKNTGVGPMLNARSYIVTEDDVMSPPQPILLGIQEEVTLDFPANGHTYRVTASQDDNFPYTDASVTYAIEGCGEENGIISTGYVTMFEESDRNLFVDTDCQESIGSYDPNDITGMPKGYGEKKYIEKEVQPEYLIRFQNTGTDTAFSVIIKNTIPESLDIRSLQMGSSSHPYTYRINQDRELVINFNHILLPDSTVNERLSHGFIKYKITPSGSLVNEDKIENEASIFFDFNAPVVTNKEFHTIGKNFIMTGIDWVEEPLSTEIYPNPSQDNFIIDMKKEKFTSATYQLINANGQVIQHGTLVNDINHINCEKVIAGKYVIKISCNQQTRAFINFIKI